MNKHNKITNISEIELKSKIYMVRDRKIMLDSDLAKIYGYTTKDFNRQVKNNLKKFEGEDFMFQLTKDEIENISRCKNSTSMQVYGTRGGRVYLPYAFTEQGIYMLMTVLRGELAIKQSRALVMMFKKMKDYIIESQDMFDYRENFQVMSKLIENTKDIVEIKDEIKKMNQRIKEAVKKSDLSPIMLDFNKKVEQNEYIFSNGQPTKTSEFYISLYSRANKSIYIIDNYIDIKTLRHLQKVRPGVDITIFSDNLGNYLHKSDYEDFLREFPKLKIKFIRTENKVHDRFVIIDYNLKIEKIYHCGASEKDAGRGKLSAIMKFGDGMPKEILKGVVEKLKENPELILN